jgi:hypothetical protein
MNPRAFEGETEVRIQRRRASGVPVPENSSDTQSTRDRSPSNDAYRFVLSIVVIATWLGVIAVSCVAAFVGPEYAADGKTILNDVPGNLAALLGVVGVVTSAIIGFWFGAAGKSSAEKQAAAATKTTTETVADTRAVVEALTTPGGNPDLDDLKVRFPRAFGVK